MVKGNPHFSLQTPYIFPVIEEKLAHLKATRPDASIVNMGIGDIALPLASSIRDAICEAVQEMSSPSFHGYGPSEGYSFLREAIASSAYPQGLFSPDEIFVSDGINTDIVNILDLFHSSVSVAVPDPAYPAYLRSNHLLGRKNIYLMPCEESEGYLPAVPKERYDLIYLCSPHNPTGTALSKEQMARFVRYALEHDSLLLVDGAYEAFVTSKDTPKSIYEIEGAKQVALEFRSFSKSAGFTGLRCGYLTLPKEVNVKLGKRKTPLHPLWRLRQSIKFNGVAYPVQRGAEACFSPLGQQQTRDQISFYLTQAAHLRQALSAARQTFVGGIDSPYIWWKAPQGMTSWQFFDYLLTTCELLTIPGSGFGAGGEGFVRLSSFTTESQAQTALQRIQTRL